MKAKGRREVVGGESRKPVRKILKSMNSQEVTGNQTVWPRL